jgi:hypothetical protein
MLTLELPEEDDDDMPPLEPASKARRGQRPKLVFVRYLPEEFSSDDDDDATKVAATKKKKKKKGKAQRSRAKSK